MRRAFLWIILFSLLFFFSLGSPVSAQTSLKRDVFISPESSTLLVGQHGSELNYAQSPDGVVHAVMFWLSTCGHCHMVIDQVLPPLQAQYGSQLDIQLIEVSSEAHNQLLLQAAETFNIPSDQVGVPFLVIGDHVLVGSGQIPAELPGLIEQYLASGGVNYPDIPGLETALPDVASGSTELPPATVATRPDGFGLGMVVLAGMVLTLLTTGTLFVRGTTVPHTQRTQRGSRVHAQYRPAKSAGQPMTAAAALGWLEWAIPVLSLLGLGVAGYLAYVETQAVEAVCGPVGDCNAVQGSPYAYLFGVIPVGVLGLVAYLLILLAWLWPRLLADNGLARYAPLVVAGLALVGTLYSIYLTYLELFVIRAICAWCLASAVIIALLLLASIGPAVQAYNLPKGESRK